MRTAAETRLQQLFRVLRGCGALMIFAAAGSFLFQHWEAAGDVTRYLGLLGGTSVFPVLAYVCGVRLEEGRSARVLMLTMLSLLPVHAGILGGFVYSQFGANLGSVASVARWVAPSPGAALLLVAGASALLIPATWAAFRVLDRAHAELLTGASVIAQALVLVPVRSALSASLCVAGLSLLLSYFLFRIRPKTLESRLALGSLVLPMVLLLGRQLFFYEATAVLWGSSAAIVAGSLFALGHVLEDETIEKFAIVPSLASMAAFACALTPPLRDASAALLFGAGMALLCVLFAGLSPRVRGFYVNAAVLINVPVLLVTIAMSGSPMAAFEAMLLGLGLLSFGFLKKRPVELYCGAAVALTGFIGELAHAIEVFALSGWFALAMLGAVIVVATAWLERRARGLRIGSNGESEPVSRAGRMGARLISTRGPAHPGPAGGPVR